ncbi:adenylate kinase family protein [Methanosphaera sp. ISO3-F5]|uniref:adenylate kinase family protein n=1 Tax=Methanosphaera sp. ISO3-F5 TaxID=1452353 RepID=UPI002B25F43F|nr:adenylate kinase family protein [Methanosphaera sp. ISO3-F5]WQH63349.1 adenylate kinase family protein [Methanosphaera sp. ISO3-F5]
MLVIITGTPGTGKTSVTSKLREKIDATFISINSLLEDYDLNLGTDEKRGYKIVDTDKMVPVVDAIVRDSQKELIIFEGHLAQDYPNADLVIVLRCDPLILRDRLNTRDWKDEKIQENVSAEILGICTSESYETYGDCIQEIETSNKSIDELADEIVDVINGDVSFSLGEIDYLADYFQML